ncbi:MAG: hypothetical protein ABSE49_05785 [Polyangiaceae bacterium]|jgi:hypothetical protein
MDSMGIMMSVGGLVVTLLVVGFSVFLFVRVFGGMRRAEAERQRLLREGIQAPARILALQMGGMTVQMGVQRNLQLRIQVEVQPPGRPPYQALITAMVSELQVAQLQPGAPVTVRIDPMNPANLALEAAGSFYPVGYAASPPAYGQPGMGMNVGMGMGGMGVPRGEPGNWPGAMVAIGGLPPTPAGAKIGMWIGIGGALVGVIVAVVVMAVNVGGVGLGSASEGSGVCAQAVRCCEVAAANSPSKANCKNLGKLGVPDSACQQSLDGFRQSAKAQGRSCP